MVFDRLENAPMYYGLGPRFQTALEWLRTIDPATLVPGVKTHLDGDNLFATYFEADTVPPQDAKLEGHLDYADIQCLVEGQECVGFALRGDGNPPKGDYKPDVQFFAGPCEKLTLTPGCFYIVWPQDLHAPKMASGAVSSVRRLVVKVKL